MKFFKVVLFFMLLTQLFSCGKDNKNLEGKDLLVWNQEDQKGVIGFYKIEDYGYFEESLVESYVAQELSNFLEEVDISSEEVEEYIYLLYLADNQKINVITGLKVKNSKNYLGKQGIVDGATDLHRATKNKEYYITKKDNYLLFGKNIEVLKNYMNQEETNEFLVEKYDSKDKNVEKVVVDLRSFVKIDNKKELELFSEKNKELNSSIQEVLAFSLVEELKVEGVSIESSVIEDNYLVNTILYSEEIRADFEQNKELAKYWEPGMVYLMNPLNDIFGYEEYLEEELKGIEISTETKNKITNIREILIDPNTKSALIRIAGLRSIYDFGREGELVQGILALLGVRLEVDKDNEALYVGMKSPSFKDTGKELEVVESQVLKYKDNPETNSLDILKEEGALAIAFETKDSNYQRRSILENIIVIRETLESFKNQFK